MDWLRRNWPDMAIGLALVAVIAGIVATLITGGSFFPVAPATPTPPSTVTAPPLPGVPAGTGTPVAPLDAPPASPGAVSVLTPEGEVAETAAPPATPSAAVPAPSVAPLSPSPVTVIPPVAETTPPAATPTPAPAVPAATTPTPAPATTPAVTTPAATAPVGGIPAASPNEAAPYRVSVGAFGSADNAARQAQTFRAAGYPVFTGMQGSLTIVLVGPYDTEAEANRVAAQIGAGGYGVAPVVYRFRPDAGTPGASTPAPAATAPAPAPAAPAPTAPAATVPAPTAAAVPTPAPAAAAPAAPPPAAAPTPIQTAASGRSLQVGAFADAGSAVPLRERLASLGLVAFEVREDGLIKLLVGPFEADRLTEVRRQLAAVGIESFPR
jgi:cell division septation protein DedD